MRPTALVVLLLLARTAPAEGQTPTIVLREVPGWFYSEGKMSPSTPTFEIVLEVRESVLVRRSVRNLTTGKTEVDNTSYEILQGLSSFNPAALRFRKLKSSERRLAPVVRALGRPGSDAVEVLFIGPDWAQSVKTVQDYMVISRFVRTQ